MHRLPLTYAVRSLRREPALVVGVTLTFSLAIGAVAAMFGLVTRLMLSAPPGVAQPERVARVTLNVRADDGEQYVMTTTSYPYFQALAGLTDAFAAVAAVRPSSFVLGRGADAEEVSGVAASGQYFTVLGAQARLGRFFSPADDELPLGNPVVVLSHAFWNARYNGRGDAIGNALVLDGLTYTIVGVAPPGFSGDNLSAVDVFVPLSAAQRGARPNWWSDANVNLVSVVVRLRDGLSPAAGATRAGARAMEMGGRHRQARIGLDPLLPASMRSSPQARIAAWLFGVAVIVLVIATANVGTLLLLRAIRKRRDIAVRLALGASRGRLATQLTTESLLLALAGGAAGLVVSQWIADAVRVTLIPTLASPDRFVDGNVLALSLALTMGAGTIAGLAPIWLVSQRQLLGELHGAGTFGTIGKAKAQRMLVGVQVALTTILLVGAGLFVQSLRRVESQDLGFSTDHLLFVTLDFRERLPAAQRDETYFEMARRLEASRGVTGASVAQGMPFGPHHIPPIGVPGMAEPPSAGGQLPILYGATPEYLKLLGVTPLQGRLFTEHDMRGSPLVALVNETMAREVWPGQGAIGKCIRVGFDPFLDPTPLAPPSLPCREIVGVVRDSRARSLRPTGREASLMQYYLPFGQLPPAFFGESADVFGLVVGVRGDMDRAAVGIQQLIQGSSTSPLYARVRPYQDLLDPQLRPWRLGATLFVALGALAIAIAAVGIFGVVSYLVTQRTREIGLRRALGGSPATIARSVVFGALRMVAIGVTVGLAVALAIGPSARAMLFDTTPHDALALVATGLMLLIVTLAAAAIPTWRAGRVSPMAALRAD